MPKTPMTKHDNAHVAKRKMEKGILSGLPSTPKESWIFLTLLCNCFDNKFKEFLNWLYLKGWHGSQRRRVPFAKLPAENLVFCLRPCMEALNIFSYSKAIAAIEVVILLTISRSIDIKKNYFANSWSSNAGSLEVVGFCSSSHGVNIHQGKKNTRTTPNEQKQYSTVTRT